MIKHVVTFRLSGSADVKREVAARFCEALNGLPSLIPELVSMETGVNVNPAEDWDVCLIATARSLEDVAAYSAHPAHRQAVEIIAPYKAARACVDFVI